MGVDVPRWVPRSSKSVGGREQRAPVGSTPIHSRDPTFLRRSVGSKANFEKKEPTDTSSPETPGTTRDYYISSLEEDTVSNRVNVIGMTVDEALPIVDRTIDHALIRGLDSIEIIHGLGTGRLKDAIRNHLKEHSYVKRFGSNEQSQGGAGVTQVEIQAHPRDPSKKIHRTG